MPDIFQEGQHVPELGGVVRGGITVVLHHPEDAVRLMAVLTSDGLSEEPLSAIYEKLAVPAFDLAMAIDNVTEESAGAALDQMARSLATLAPLARAEAEELFLSIILAYGLWDRSAEPGKDLCLLLSMPQPVSGRVAELEIDGHQTGLVLDRGSIRARIMWGTLRATGFAVGLFLAPGGMPTIWAADLAESMRARALAAGCLPLDRIDQIRTDDLRDRCGVIIFVHGLLSTDLGLFDNLLSRLRDDHEFGDRVALVGWPHDTLAGIDDSGRQLARAITRAIDITRSDDEMPRVAFVCHSRGGLVARSAVAKLLDNSPRWLKKLGGCVTFGTPHEGAAIANSPDEFLGMLVVSQVYGSTRSFATVCDAIRYLGRLDAAGILDLRPASGGGEFLARLLDTEGKQIPGRERALEILAVGGDVPPDQTSLLHRVARRPFAGHGNDLVVEIESSAPPQFAHPRNTACDHFSYFSVEEMEGPTFDHVRTFLKATLELDQCRIPPRTESEVIRETRRRRAEEQGLGI